MLATVVDRGRRSRTTFVALGIGIVLLVATMSRSALAQATRAGDSHAQLDRAVAAFQAQDYPTALSLFQQLYIDTRQPALLYNIGLAQERLHHYQEAVRALRQYLVAVPDAPNRPQVESQLAQFESELASSVQASASPSPAPIVASSSPPPLRRVVVRGSQPVWPWLIAGAGAVALGVGIGLLPGAGAGITSTSTFPNEAAYLAALDGANTQQGVGIVLIAAGGAVLVTGVVLALVTWPRESVVRSSRAVFDVTPVPGGGMVSATVVGF